MFNLEGVRNTAARAPRLAQARTAGLLLCLAALLACDGKPIDGVLPGGRVAVVALPPEEPALVEGQGVGGSGTAGTDEEAAASRAASAQELLWTRELLGSSRTVGH